MAKKAAKVAEAKRTKPETLAERIARLPITPQSVAYRTLVMYAEAGYALRSAPVVMGVAVEPEKLSVAEVEYGAAIAEISKWLDITEAEFAA